MRVGEEREEGGIASLRKILHAEPPLNPLHRVEVIFARIFLVFCPSSRISGVQGSLALLLSFPLSSCSRSSSPSRHIAANPRSLFVHLSIYLRFSLSIVARSSPRPVSRPRSRAAFEREASERIAASACISTTHARKIFETMLAKLPFTSLFGEVFNSYC